ncbi:hypothetical protein P7K49_005866, partial [Saguinus oedipus]
MALMVPSWERGYPKDCAISTLGQAGHPAQHLAHPPWGSRCGPGPGMPGWGGKTGVCSRQAEESK